MSSPMRRCGGGDRGVWNTSRIARSAIEKCRRLGLRVGLLRPITLYRFRSRRSKQVIARTQRFSSWK